MLPSFSINIICVFSSSSSPSLPFFLFFPFYYIFFSFLSVLAWYSSGRSSYIFLSWGPLVPLHVLLWESRRGGSRFRYTLFFFLPLLSLHFFFLWFSLLPLLDQYYYYYQHQHINIRINITMLPTSLPPSVPRQWKRRGWTTTTTTTTGIRPAG